MSKEHATTIGHEFVAIFNEQNTARADKIFADDLVAHVSGAPPLDRAGWKAYVELFRASFPDLRLELNDLIATDDTVVLRVTLRGTHTAAFQGIPATNVRVAFPGIAMHRLKDGRVVEHWGVRDLLSLMQQLGAIPGPEQTANDFGP